MDNTEKEKIMASIMQILKRGNEAVVRKRSKNGEHYIEVAEQQYKKIEKYTQNKK